MKTAEQYDIFESEILPLFEETREDFLARARRIAVELANVYGEVTVDDVRYHCPPPEGIDGRVMGAIFKTGEWVHVGYRKSSRSTCHKRPISVFRRAA